MTDLPKSLLYTAREIIATGCGCDRGCEKDDDEWYDHCSCIDDAERIVALVAHAERERILAVMKQFEDKYDRQMKADPYSEFARVAQMLSMAAVVLAQEINPTSSEAGQALGCASEGGVSAPSSDNPNT